MNNNKISTLLRLIKYTAAEAKESGFVEVAQRIVDTGALVFKSLNKNNGDVKTPSAGTSSTRDEE